MKRMISVLLACLLATTAAAKPASATEWELASERDGIVVWTRTIPGAPLKDFRGRMVVDMPLDAVAAGVTDAATYPEWFFQMREARILEGASMDDVYVYFVIGGIWPVSDRDAVARATVTQDPKTLAVRMIADATPDKIPPVKGLVRMPKMKSGWELTPLSPTRTQVELIGNADPGGMIPLWLANSVVQMMPRETLKRLRRQLDKPKYANPGALFNADPLLREFRASIRLPGE
ncbi:MAG: START domain-containing protein [Gammaproteobacteria bacterium]